MHSLPIGFSLDDARGVREPRGMLARQFGVDMHVVTADLATPRNLMLAVEQCHLTVEAMVASPYAASLAVLADDESDLGAAVIDMGAGTTTIAAFLGRPLHPCRRLRARGAARGPSTWRAGSAPESRMPSESKRSMALCWPVETMNGT
jgi:cell division protein FtsA